MKKYFLIFCSLLIAVSLSSFKNDSINKQDTLNEIIKANNLDTLLKPVQDNNKSEIDNSFLSKENNIWWKFLPLFVAILSFFLGQTAIFARDWYVERKRLKEIREYFFICLIHFKKGIEGQVEIFKKTAKQFDDDTTVLTALHRGVSKQIESSTTQVLSITTKDVFSFFILKNKDRKNNERKNNERKAVLNSFYSLLELTKEIYDSIDENNIHLDKNYIKNVDLIDGYANKILDLMAEADHIYLKSGDRTPYHTEMTEAFHKYRNEERTIDNIEQKLMQPFYEISMKYPEHPDSLFIILQTQYSRAAYVEILNAKKQYSQKIKHWIMVYESMIRLVDKVIEFEFKNFNSKKNS